MAEGWKAKENQESLYIKILELQMKYFDNVWVQHNPIIRIQRYWKKAYKEKMKDRYLQKSGKK